MLHIRVLGPLDITQNGDPISGVVSKKVTALLVYLAVTGTAHSRDHLAGLLWGDMPDADAKSNLRQALANLRRLIEPHILATPDAIALNRTQPYVLDVEAFHAALKAPDASIAQLCAAADLYRGDFLQGFYVRDAVDFDEWAVTQRERYRELASNALHTVISRLTARRDYMAGIEYATRLLALDPWREEAHRQMMLLLARSGQRSAALAQFAECRRILAEEMGAEPTAETIALYERIRAGGAKQRSRLPLQLTPFVGRQRELEEMCVRLADPLCRLLTLVGPGGVGKTRLALQAAEQCGELFLNGIDFVSLSDECSSESFLTAIADVLHLSLRNGTDAKTQVIDCLQSREMLLILDGFENLIGSRSLISDILQRAPDVKILVTSSQRLDVHGEWVMDVVGLDVPGEDAPVNHRAYSAVELFVHSARRVQPAFDLASSDEAAHALRICQLVDGLPLGIELAACWVRALPCASIAQEIERSLDFLATTQHGVPERQRSLRAVFESSWNRLSAEERTVLAALSVFHGGFSREAAQQVAGASFSVLLALVDKSLLRPPLRVAGRFSLHAVIQQYASERLAASPEAQARAQAQHCAYYSAFVQEREAWLKSARLMEGLAQIGGDIRNVRAAWQWASQHLTLTELRSLAAGLFRFYDLRAWYEEGKQAFARAAAALAGDQANDPQRLALMASALVYQADFCVGLGQLPQAKALAETALAGFRHLQAATPAEQAMCLDVIGAVARLSGQYEESKHVLLAALELRRHVGDSWATAGTIHNLAVAASALGEFEAAQSLHQESLALRRSSGDPQGIALSLEGLGTVAQNLGNYHDAVRLRQESLEVLRAIGDQFAMGRTLNNLAVAFYKLGQYAEAKQTAYTGLDVARAGAYSVLIACLLDNIGISACALGQYDEAERSLRDALAMAREMKAAPLVLSFLADVARLLAEEAGKKPHARARAEQAVEMAARVLSEPAAWAETKNKATALLAELATRLDSAAYAAAEQRGQSLPLAKMIASFCDAA